MILLLASTKINTSEIVLYIITLYGSSSQSHAPIDSASINVPHEPTRISRKRQSTSWTNAHIIKYMDNVTPLR